MGLDMYLSAKLETYKPYGNEKENPIRVLLKKELPIFKSENIVYDDDIF